MSGFSYSEKLKGNEAALEEGQLATVHTTGSITNKTDRLHLGKDWRRLALPSKWETHPEDQGILAKGVNKGDGNTNVTLSLALNEAETKAASRERRQVLFNVTCEEGSSQENARDAALIYSVIEYKLATNSNSQQAMVEAIFTPEPTNPWHWSAIFESIQTKEHYNNRDTDFVSTIKGREVNYHLRTVRAPQHLLVIV